MKKYIIGAIRIIFLALFVFLIIKGKMMLWLAFYGASLIFALFFGRVYCGYVCPMNTLMLPTQWVSKKLKIQTDKTPKWLLSGFFVWVALIVSVAVMLLSKKLLHINIPILMIWLGLSVLITLRYKPDVFHNYICPFGALQKVFGRFAIFSHRVKKDNCSGCKICEKSCPTKAIKVTEEKKAEIKTSHCLQCNSCAQACPKKTIKYTTKSKSL